MTSTDKEIALNEAMQTLDDSLEDGPADGELPEAFLKRVKKEVKDVENAIQALTSEDVDEIFEEGEEV